MTFNLDEERFRATSARMGVAPSICDQAWENLASGRTIGLAMNGKIASGKDTVAPEVMDAAGRTDVVHLYFAEPLKREASDLIAAVELHKFIDEAIDDLVERFAVTATDAAVAAGLLWVPTHDQDVAPFNGWTRTSTVRALLQYWGTEVRRRQDPDYWIRHAAPLLLEQLAAGNDIFLTDLRFPNEAQLAADLHIHTVRLEVTPATQIARLRRRDGHEPDLSTLEHPGEVALDDYTGFSLVVDNNGPLGPTVSTIVAFLAEQRRNAV